jgi:hypothetical protein
MESVDRNPSKLSLEVAAKDDFHHLEVALRAERPSFMGRGDAVGSKIGSGTIQTV